MINAMTVDVEESFHPTEVSRDQSEWNSLPCRLNEQIPHILEMFERRRVKATFFTLGWAAERFPDMVRQIAAAGHEIGCHSYAHKLVYQLTPEQFRADTMRAVAAIQDACGIIPRVYRAPSYSITTESWWALDVLAECGFTHDSSIYPISHDRYGIPGFGRHSQMLQTRSGPIFEIPIATVKLTGGRVSPVGGGGYLRMLPYSYTAAGIRRMNRVDGLPACIYFHPWEVDPGIPRLAVGRVAQVRTYMGLKKMERKIDRLLNDFQFSCITEAFPIQGGAHASAGA